MNTAVMCFHMVAEKHIFSELYKSDKSTSLQGYILITEILFTGVLKNTLYFLMHINYMYALNISINNLSEHVIAECCLTIEAYILPFILNRHKRHHCCCNTVMFYLKKFKLQWVEWVDG